MAAVLLNYLSFDRCWAFLRVPQMQVNKAVEVYNCHEGVEDSKQRCRVYLESELGLSMSHCPFMVIVFEFSWRLWMDLLRS